jgi:hypothetical protein
LGEKREARGKEKGRERGMGHVDGVYVREKGERCTVGKWVGNMGIDLFVQHGLHGTCMAVSDSVGIF